MNFVLNQILILKELEMFHVIFEFLKLKIS